VPERVPAPKPNRPRNPDAPPKPRRPRDELGRPLAFGETSRLELEDFDSFTLERNHELGIGHFNAGRFFPAHEAWETAWKQSKGTPDAEFFKGLSQLGAGYVHLQRANAHGAFTLMRRAVGRIERYPSPHLGVDTQALAAAATRDADTVEHADQEGRPIPEVTPPRI
jgi:predicted metal-dependent hydrolase